MAGAKEPSRSRWRAMHDGVRRDAGRHPGTRRARPARGVRRRVFALGSPLLRRRLARAGLEAIREKSLTLTEHLVALVDARLDGFVVGTPREPSRRGGHVALDHPAGKRIAAALGARGAVVDFRPPNVVRVCPAPLYTSYSDVWAFVDELRTVVESRAYEDLELDGDVTRSSRGASSRPPSAPTRPDAPERPRQSRRATRPFRPVLRARRSTSRTGRPPRR